MGQLGKLRRLAIGARPNAGEEAAGLSNTPRDFILPHEAFDHAAGYRERIANHADCGWPSAFT